MRKGKPVTLNLPGDLDMLSMIKSSPRFVDLYVPLQIDSVMKDSPASKLGLAKGDKILAINNKKVVSFNEFQIELGRVEDVLASAETPRIVPEHLQLRLLISRLLAIPSSRVFS